MLKSIIITFKTNRPKIHLYTMNVKFFYVYFIAGLIFVALFIYNLIRGNGTTYTMCYDIAIALLLFYRGYRAYNTKKDQELM